MGKERQTRDLLGYLGDGAFFGRMPDELLKAPSFRELSPIAKLVLFCYLRKFQRVTCGGARGKAYKGVPFAVSDSAEWELSAYQHRTGLSELVAAGFLKRVRKGGGKAHAAYWPATDWCDESPF